MNKVSLYIAASLDGYIAEKNGSVAFLDKIESGEEDYGYYDFYNSIDALIMGRKTYDFCSSLDTWPYAGKQTFVFTSKKLKTQRTDIEFLNMKPSAEMYRISTAGYKNIWLVGGGNLNTQFLNSNLIDEIILTLIPIILGEGIPLFPRAEQKLLHLISIKSYPSGIIQTIYKPK